MVIKNICFPGVHEERFKSWFQNFYQFVFLWVRQLCFFLLLFEKVIHKGPQEAALPDHGEKHLPKIVVLEKEKKRKLDAMTQETSHWRLQMKQEVQFPCSDLLDSAGRVHCSNSVQYRAALWNADHAKLVSTFQGKKKKKAIKWQDLFFFRSRIPWAI